MSSYYIEATRVAKQFGVSSATIQRRIKEGKIFPGAKKDKQGFGGVWLIPRQEVKVVTLEQVSPKLYEERYGHEDKSVVAVEGTPSPAKTTTTIEELEKRIVDLERIFIRQLAKV